MRYFLLQPFHGAPLLPGQQPRQFPYACAYVGRVPETVPTLDLAQEVFMWHNDYDNPAPAWVRSATAGDLFVFENINVRQVEACTPILVDKVGFSSLASEDLPLNYKTVMEQVL